MNEYVYEVSDSEGLWGDLRIVEQTENAAREACTTYLELHEVYPKGSLEKPFTLKIKEQP